jgi:hypothetical protein
VYPRMLYGPIGSRRAYTDPISNAVVITGIEPTAVALDLAAGRFSEVALGPFLHETAHHACFDTPVGIALGALKLAHTASPLSTIHDADELVGPASDLIKAEAVREFLNPLLEGLALFAEFDVHPGTSLYVSSVSQSAARVFGLGRSLNHTLRTGRINLWEALADFFFVARSDANFVERKIALLSSSLRSPDGYLLGYLLVKNLWWMLIRRARKFTDPDLYFGFVRHFLFNDMYFANLLLNHSETLEEEIQAIAEYLTLRIRDMHDNAATFLDEYEGVLARWEPGTTRILGTPSDSPHAGYENHSESLERRLLFESSIRSLRTANLFWPNLIAGRAILRVAVAYAEITTDEAGGFVAQLAGSGESLHGPIMHDMRPLDAKTTSGKGTVEALLLPDKKTILLGVFLGQDLIAVRDVSTGQFNDDSVAGPIKRMPSWLAIEAALVEIEDERNLLGGKRSGELLVEYQKGARELAYESYYEIGLGRDDTAEINRALLDKMDRAGFAELFVNVADRRVMEFAAKLSMAVNREPLSFGQLPDLLQMSETHIRSCYDQLKEIAKTQLGFMPVFEHNDHLFLSRI